MKASMKTLTVLATFFCLISSFVQADIPSAPTEPATLNTHMKAMGDILKSIIKPQQPLTDLQKADLTVDFREHVLAAFAFVPNKVAELPLAEQRLANLQCSRALSALLPLSIDLEEALLASDAVKTKKATDGLLAAAGAGHNLCKKKQN